ncbi:proline dehydrogenase [Geothrix oryzae]|uniref:Proline dehydrogenase n=1 Tax=Geothrix oryzae TaxID=2927975 RepID=A0ABN6UXN9_9BACT|nr:proline dehydrogenase family protein [Geothrix oryzae]BDU69616.1 proline dehydrogenase [Geothrix oryzae]
MDLKRTILDLMPDMLVRTFAAPYCAGKGISSGVAKADEIHSKLGLSTTLDLLGEEVFKREDVEATVQVYFRMIEAVKDRPFATISLKPTQLGINESEAYCQENLRRIVAAAAEHKIHITLDMEDRHFTDVTLRMFKAIRNEFDNFGIVLQSRLFRTPEDIKALHEKPCKVRICIGIYKEPAEVALQDKRDMKEKLFECVQLLLEHGHYPEIATHDEPTVRRCMAYLDQRGVSKDAYEFQMLLGVPRMELQQEIVKRGQVMRLYVPFAENWKYAVAYMKRRLGANPAMAAMVIKNLFGR